jgi:murein DD-endopeptidase MepM/ murein hydrolase activator NlpD
MTTSRPTSVSGARPRKLAGLAGAAILAIASLVPIALLADTPSADAAGSVDALAGYGWPVAPFDRPHPVRANFGDPRTTFHGPPTAAGLMTSKGIFAFHFGVDISVPDGTPVYAVKDGVASLLGTRNVRVDSGDGFVTEYWHIVPAVRDGQDVTARQTVLGRVMRDYEHVHFAEFHDGRPVNPLAAGHLGPYADLTAPQVASISFRRDASATEVIPESVSGQVVPVTHIQDLPALHASGIWRDLPVAPALVCWRVERATDGRVVVRRRVAFDVRRTMPRNDVFWRYYARGSRQNMATFGTQRAWRTPGTYLFRLAQQPWDTRTLRNGVYRLVVTATDIRGNTGELSQVFIVRNGGRS